MHKLIVQYSMREYEPKHLKWLSFIMHNLIKYLAVNSTPKYM